MSVKFCVLGSGSDGNAALLMTPFLHVLIDAGFPPNEMAARMEGTGAAWQSIRAIVLTHTHADHLKRRCLTECCEHDIEFWCHTRHAEQLQGSRYFKHLTKKNLVKTFDGSSSFEISARNTEGTHTPHLRFHPIPVPHDCKPTFGYRIEARKVSAMANCEVIPQAESVLVKESDGESEYGHWVRLGYLVDLGDCSENISSAVHDVDLLALEFNHDEQMQRKSGRHPFLIERVLGKDGHLSNKQAADVFRRVLEQCPNGGPKLLVQMHLSRECNRAELAYEAAQQVLLMTGSRAQVFSTRQDKRGTVHSL